MKALLNTIDTLENKRDNGTITMEQEVTLIRLIEMAESFINA
jgi:hypothetical protein